MGADGREAELINHPVDQVGQGLPEGVLGGACEAGRGDVVVRLDPRVAERLGPVAELAFQGEQGGGLDAAGAVDLAVALGRVHVAHVQPGAVDEHRQVHAGAEYLWILPKYVFALRGGAVYDPEPIMDEINEFYGVSIGGGIAYQNIIVDAAFQYRWGSNLNGERVENVEAETDAQEYNALVSVIYHFE